MFKKHKNIFVGVAAVLIVVVGYFAQGELFQGTLDIDEKSEPVEVETPAEDEERRESEESAPAEEEKESEPVEEVVEEEVQVDPDIAVTDMYLSPDLTAMVELQVDMAAEDVAFHLTKNGSVIYTWGDDLPAGTTLVETKPIDFGYNGDLTHELEVCVAIFEAESDYTNNCFEISVAGVDTQVDLKMTDLTLMCDGLCYSDNETVSVEVWNDSDIQMNDYFRFLHLWNIDGTEIVASNGWYGAIGPNEIQSFTLDIPSADPDFYDLEVCFYPVVETTGIHEFNYDDNCMSTAFEVVTPVKE